MTNDEIVDAYAEAFKNADPQRVRQLVAPGAVIWHNFDERDRDVLASPRTGESRASRSTSRQSGVARLRTRHEIGAISGSRSRRAFLHDVAS
jgi:hypothetical protein